MNYIYDIYLNLNKTLYDFFDWYKTDKIIHIKKIPIFKINVDNFGNLVNYNIKIECDLLNKVHNSTEIWGKEQNIENCALFCDDNNIIAIQFNNNGLSIKKSFLMIDEEAEVLEDVQNLKETNMRYEKIKKTNILFKTRKEIKEELFIKKELINIDNEKLNYIYLECFGKTDNNKQKKINKLIKIKSNSNLHKNLYNILKLTSTTKN